MVRRFGPVRAAGVVIVEKESEPAIIPGALGTTAYSGILKKGPIGKVFRAKTKTEFLAKAGGIIPESLLPNAAFNFFTLSNGAGELWLNRITDGNEKLAKLTIKDRQVNRSSALLVKAGNAGRWAGKKLKIVDEYASITATSLTLSNPPTDLKNDELVGAMLKLKAVPGKSFEVVSNDDAGVLQFAGDVNLLDEVGTSTNVLLSVELENSGEALGVLFKDGLTNPTDEWGLEIYSIEGGVATRVKNYDSLSSDSTKSNYFERLINDDSNADYNIRVEDLNIGTVTANKRPANLAGKSIGLTDTTLKVKVYDSFVSAAQLAKAELVNVVLGAEAIEDKITLTLTAVGARATESLTFSAIPDDGDSIAVNGKVITFKTIVVDATSQVLIGGTVEETVDNLIAFMAASVDALIKGIIFTEKFSASVVDFFAYNAGLAGNSIAVTSTGGGNEPTFGAAVLSGGLDQTWSYLSEKMPFVTGEVVTTGIAYVGVNDFAFSFTLNDITGSSAKEFQLGDTIVIEMMPMQINKLAGGVLIPNVLQPRKKYLVVSNSAETVTVKTGATMTDFATLGDDFRVEYIQELEAGYDGIAGVNDFTYEEAYDTATSPLKGMRGKNLGLVKLATPGVTSIAVQKAGVAFAASQNWQYRYEIPSTITDELAAEEFINDTIGRNDFAVVTFPSFIKESAPGGGLKLISATGAIHGLEARTAVNYLGFHKAAAGVDQILSNALALPDGLNNKELDEEFLNPNGINIMKVIDGNVVLWGDRTVGIDPAFKFKHHREYLSHTENVMLENYNFIIFALNNKETVERLKGSFVQYFTPELAKGAIEGKTVQEAIGLKIDEENNTDITRAAGDLNAELSLKIVDVVERFVITVSKVGVTEG